MVTDETITLRLNATASADRIHSHADQIAPSDQRVADALHATSEELLTSVRSLTLAVDGLRHPSLAGAGMRYTAPQLMAAARRMLNALTDLEGYAQIEAGKAGDALKYR